MAEASHAARSAVVCPGAARGGAAFLALVAMLWFAVPLAADDDALKDRLTTEVVRIEAGIAALDGKVAVEQPLVQRVAALDARLIALETASGLVPGKIRGGEDLKWMAGDLASLATRWKAIVKAKAPPTEKPGGAPAPTPPVNPAPADPAKEGKAIVDPVRGRWPARLEFNATAKASYQETGHWEKIYALDGTVLDQQFFADGYSGSVSFTVRTKGMVQDVKSLIVRVGVRLSGVLTDPSNEYRVYEVKWVADRALADGSYNTWLNYGNVTVHGAVPWASGPPRRANLKLDAQAWLLSAVLKDGKEITFEAPDFKPR